MLVRRYEVRFRTKTAEFLCMSDNLETFEAYRNDYPSKNYYHKYVGFEPIEDIASRNWSLEDIEFMYKFYGDKSWKIRFSINR